MARSRNIKPGFFANDLLAEINPLGRLLFIGLWTMADREGRLEDRPKRIKAELLPYDDCDINALLTALHASGFIVRYEVAGERFIQIAKFTKHQNPHIKEPASSIPEPGEHCASTVQAPDKNSSGPADSGFLIPDTGSLIPDPRVETPATRSPKGSRLSTQSMPDEFLDFCRQERPDLDPHRTWNQFRDHWIAIPGKGGVRLDWLATWRKWVRGERAPQQARASPVGRQSAFDRNAEIAASLSGKSFRQDIIDVTPPKSSPNRMGAAHFLPLDRDVRNPSDFDEVGAD